MKKLAAMLEDELDPIKGLDYIIDALSLAKKQLKDGKDKKQIGHLLGAQKTNIDSVIAGLQK